MASDSQSNREKAFEDMDLLSQNREIKKALRKNTKALKELREKLELLRDKLEGEKKE